MPFSFSYNYPEALWLLLLLPLVIIMALKGGSGVVRRKSARRLSIGLRLTMVSLLVFGIAGTNLVTSSNNMAAVFLLDYSDSTGTNGRSQSVDFVQKAMLGMNQDQQAGVVVFGQEALVQKPVSRDKQIGQFSGNPGGNFTNLAEAVRLGTALLPGNIANRLVLVSDGNQNVDEVRTAARLAAARGIKIDVLPMQVQLGPEVSVAGLQVPNSLRKGEEFELKIAVDSNYAGPASLQILQDGQMVSEKPVDLKSGANLFTEIVSAKTEGPVNYSARVVAPQDTIQQNNQTQVYGVVKNSPRVLLVEGHPDQKEAANLSAALIETGIETLTVPPDKLPDNKELTRFDSVILVNVPGSSLKTEEMKMLQSFVKDQGKGLITVGGEESYGVGGWFRTPLEEMLPLELQLPSKLEVPSVAMVLVVDRSGSMAASYTKPGSPGPIKSKLEIAKDAAYLAVTQLSSTDQVGVVVFDTLGRWQIPLGVVGDPSRLGPQIGRIALGGGTNIYSGLAPAVEGLKDVTAKNKHIILLTDGQDRDRGDYNTVMEEAVKANITVSTVGLGDDVNSSFLQGLATRGNGRYTLVDDANNLPKIFAKEARLAARSYIIEENFAPTISDPSPMVKRITGTPELKGYVATKAKRNATVALVTRRNEPLLAHWQYGLGRVAAWTSDAKGRWASNWLTWPDFPRFWSQVVRWTVAENSSEGLQVQTAPSGNQIKVSADALGSDSSYLNGLEVKAKVSTGPNSPAEEVVLRQTAPGHYEGYFTPKQTSSYLVQVESSGQPGQKLTGAIAGTVEAQKLSQTVGASANYSPEYKQLGTNNLLLRDIAAMTGGRVLTGPEEVFADTGQRSPQHHPIWPWLLLAALLLLPLDIAARTVRFSPSGWRKSYREYKAQKASQAVASSPAPPLVEVAMPVAASSYSQAEYSYSEKPPSYSPPSAPNPNSNSYSPDYVANQEALIQQLLEDYPLQAPSDEQPPPVHPD